MGEAVRERGVPARLLTGRMDGEGTRGDLARDRCGDRRYASSGNGEATGTLSFTSGGPNTRIGSSVPVLVVRSLGILPRSGVPWGGISGSRGGASPSTHWVARPTAGLCWVSIWYRYTRALPWASSRANSVLRPASSRKRSSSTKRRVERRVLLMNPCLSDSPRIVGRATPSCDGFLNAAAFRENCVDEAVCAGGAYETGLLLPHRASHVFPIAESRCPMLWPRTLNSHRDGHKGGPAGPGQADEAPQSRHEVRRVAQAL